MKIFLSYSHEDESLARQLVSRLAEAGHETWLDRHEVMPGDNLGLEVGKALENSQAMVVLVSPESMESSWVRSQIDFALGSKKYAGRVIPVLVRPTTEIPWFVKSLQTIRSGENPEEISKEIVALLERAKKRSPHDATS